MIIYGMKKTEVLTTCQTIDAKHKMTEEAQHVKHWREIKNETHVTGTI